MKTIFLRRIDFKGIEPMSDKQMVELNGGFWGPVGVAVTIALWLIDRDNGGGTTNNGCNSGCTNGNYGC